MKQRELISLPIGEYKLTDGIYTYKLEKPNTDTYRIKEERGTHCINLFERKAESLDSDFRLNQPILVATSLAGGLCVIMREVDSMINNLQLIPRGSFKAFIKLTSDK